ncbi:hypothetical protein BDA99DRAFT_95318 [Phascolomyces articulosus]|nr:hypothetical protein BDA99DRAFT_95318 [Phascolomyces articulosus]
MFNDLDDNKMWQLSTGKKVEHQMKKMALGVTHEHLACSLVLDPDDKDWLNYFTKQELEEIKNESVPVISTLPKPLLEYIDKYKGLKSLDEIRNINIQHNFHPLQEPDLHWIDSSISKVLDIMYYKYLAKRRSESDLMKHIWVLIDTCFYASTIDAISGETSSKSTSNRVNHVQSTTTDSSSPSSSSSAPSSSSPPPTESLSSTMARKQIGNKTDIRFATEVFEFGTVEAGKESNITSKKTIIESGFKIPKILKDMFIQLLKESPTSVREIKTFGFTLSGISMLPQILDCPQGYVCRMNRTQKWLHYPSGPEDFVPRMKSLITVVHHMKTLATMMLDVISDSDSNVQFGSSAIDIQIPACFSPSVSTTNKRKKQSTNDSSNKKTKTDQA